MRLNWTVCPFVIIGADSSLFALFCVRLTWAAVIQLSVFVSLQRQEVEFVCFFLGGKTAKVTYISAQYQQSLETKISFLCAFALSSELQLSHTYIEVFIRSAYSELNPH